MLSCMKYASKDAFLDRMAKEHDAFLAIGRSIPADRYEEPGVWGDNWNVKDLYAHLTAWEGLYLSWFRTGERGKSPDMPAPGYKWNQTRELNHAIRTEHAGRTQASVKRSFTRSYNTIRAHAEGLSERELLEDGHFEWTGTKPLVSYLGANTASHYATCAKILKRWTRANLEPTN
ncbi:MAG: DfsB family protein [Phycisphaera sp.]|nr:MAG: DfsB family protein [Phycisphaera sp.]